MIRPTIAALATAPGIAGISVIRISGTDSIEICDKCFVGKVKLQKANSHTIHYGNFEFNNEMIDTVLVSIFRNPNSYTGEDVIEISSHGGMIVASRILEVLYKSGANPAEPGEFTKRAFLNAKLDLAQVEAVADLIHSVSVAGAATAAKQLQGHFTAKLACLREHLIKIAGLLELELDFSEEDLEFIDKKIIKQRLEEGIEYCKELLSSYKSSQILRSGYFVGIAGFPNSGKSTLFNTILGRDRAIVSEIAGTTRDYIEESIYLGQIPVRFVDTAGIRETEDLIEIEGIKFVESVLCQSNLIVILNDISNGNESIELYNKIKSKYPEADIIYVNNKIDKIDSNKLADLQNKIESKTLFISAINKIGIIELKNYIEKSALVSTERVTDVLINQRHYDLLVKVNQYLQNAHKDLEILKNELLAIEIRNAGSCIGEIIGLTWNDDVLNSVFGQFCIGK